MIPQNVHMIWLQGWDKLPPKYYDNVKSIEEKNPNYNIIKWEDKSIRDILKYLGDNYLQKYDNFQTIHQRVDMGRYAILYALGGVSCDVDVVAYKSFDETPNLNDSSMIVSYNSSSGFENYVKHGKSVSLNNATILVSRNNPIMKGLLDHIMELSCDINESKEQCIQNTTGPREFTKYLDQYKDQITVLDNTYFEPCSGYMDECEIKPNTILQHKHEASWVGDTNKLIGRVYYKIKQHRDKILIAITIIVIFILISNTPKS